MYNYENILLCKHHRGRYCESGNNKIRKMINCFMLLLLFPLNNLYPYFKQNMFDWIMLFKTCLIWKNIKKNVLSSKFKQTWSLAYFYNNSL